MVGNSNRTAAHNALGLSFVACMDSGTCLKYRDQKMAGIDILLQLLPLAYFGGYVLLPRQLRLERESYIRLPTVPEANAQSSHLLEEEEGSEQNTA